MKQILNHAAFSLVGGLLMLSAQVVTAQSNAPAPAPASTTPASTAAIPVKVELQADAEVRKMDKETGKVTLKHGEIKSLDMPPMTMVFVVKDKALMDKFKVGDKIKFNAVKEGSQYVVTDLAVQKP
jgi:Cu(I)/Ag(I) efflux system periplasmic protein CusF